jgi:hypothetical protein
MYRLQQDSIAVEVQESALPFGEAADVDDLFRLHAHSLKRRTVSDWRDNQRAGIIETDEAAVKQVVDGGGGRTMRSAVCRGEMADATADPSLRLQTPA